MSFLDIEQQRIERLSVSNIKDAAVTGKSCVSEILDFYDGGSQYQVLVKMAERFCTRIERRKDWREDEAASDDDGLYYANPIIAARAAVKAKLFEVTTTDIMQKIVRYVGSLAQDTEYKFIDDNGDEVEDFAADIKAARKAAGFLLKLGRVEEMAVPCGCVGVLIQQLGTTLDYQPIPSNKLWVVHGGSIIDESLGRDNELRPTNRLDLEEASVVVVELGCKGDNRFEFVAYFPRSTDWPNGRQVKYIASEWHMIPDVDAQGDGHVEHYNNVGEIDNPLTTLQETSGDYSIPEIPIVIWRGTPSGIGKELIPTTTSLWENSLELELSNSRTLTAANKSATGTIVITQEQGMNAVMPDNIGEGINKLPAGAGMNIISVPAANVETLQNIVETQSAFLASAWSVPTNAVKVSDDGTQTVSGASLIQQTKPASKMRAKRADINRAAMNRWFMIELGHARISRDDSKYGAGIMQEWIVNEMPFPKTDLEKMEEFKYKMTELKIVDDKDAVIKFIPGIHNREDAIAYLEERPQAPAPRPTLQNFR